MSYDPDNVFARVLSGEIPCDRLYEDEHVLAFTDINPQAPRHILVIPKGQYRSFDDFSETASDGEIVALVRAMGKIARSLGLDASGYRLLANHGPDSHQEVPHLHLHILGGRPMGPLLTPPR